LRSLVFSFLKELNMMLGMSLSTFTLFHTILSVVGILAGIPVVLAIMRGRLNSRFTALFLATTVTTSVTGFMFPFHKFLPSHGVGTLSLIVLAITIPALYTFHLAGPWKKVYVIGAIVALYFNVFVLVVQAFLKVPALHALAPNGNEPAFLIAQTIALAIFIAIGVIALKRSRKSQILSMAAD
jgi:hypothetical protein